MNPAVVTVLMLWFTQALIQGTALAASSAASTWVFVCEDRSEWVVRGDETSAWLFSPTGSRQLPAVHADSGLHYADDRFDIRIDADTARLREADNEPTRCRNDRKRAIWEKAKLEGVDFRATGNEPGWVLEIVRGDTLVLVSDYGASRVELPLPEPSVDRQRRASRWDAGELVVEVMAKPCRDSMSGDAFESTVIVRWKGRILAGCGRALH